MNSNIIVIFHVFSILGTRQRDYGAWSGKPWVEYKNASKRNNGTSNEFYHSLPGVETDDKLLKR